MTETTLVVPTIREDCINKFLESWDEELSQFERIIIIEDNPKKTFKLKSVEHYCWEDIDEKLGENSWIISRRDSAIRSFGFMLAKDSDYVYTLDDDCLRIPDENFIEQHKENLNFTNKWCELIPGMRTRGLPYKRLGILENVMFSIGLWTKVPDLDAISQLSNPIDNFYPNVLTRVMPEGQYFPLTGMNFCFRKEAAVLSYFPLMGDGYPYRRFDDIWFGIICKKICDHLKFRITCGHPYVCHFKASDPFVNLIKEAPGIQMNETFWMEIDNIKLMGDNPSSCMEEIGNALTLNANPYLSKLGKAIVIWRGYFG